MLALGAPPSGAAFASGCFPYDVREGLILLGCRRPYEEPIEPFLADPATGRIDPVPGARPQDFFGWLGAHWLVGSECDAGHPDPCGTVSLNWRTGERLTYVADPDRPDPGPYTRPPDALRLAGPASRNPRRRGPLLPAPQRRAPARAAGAGWPVYGNRFELTVTADDELFVAPWPR